MAGHGARGWALLPATGLALAVGLTACGGSAGDEPSPTATESASPDGRPSRAPAAGANQCGGGRQRMLGDRWGIMDDDADIGSEPNRYCTGRAIPCDGGLIVFLSSAR